MVSSSSTTGKKSSFDNKQIDYFQKIRSLSLKNPTVIGFGISDKESFMQACKYSNGAIIGSKFIQSLSKSNIKKSIRSFVYSVR